MDAALLNHITTELEAAACQLLGLVRSQPVSGGHINDAYRITTEDGRGKIYFLKVNTHKHAPLFVTEAVALRAMAAANAIRVPKPLFQGTFQQWSYLVLEYLNLQTGAGTMDGYTLMGQQLAGLHRTLSPSGMFGWPEANFIGSTPQPNRWRENWIDFWRHERLGHQFALAVQRGHPFCNTDRLLDRLPAFFDDYEPAPSLLHGDLWGGNAGIDDTGAPVLYDPASYYGDRETDLAFTQLFGGFPSSFYTAYNEAWPRHPGWKQREPLYQLYYLLNHDHLFGGHYHDQAQGVIDRLNQEV